MNSYPLHRVCLCILDGLGSNPSPIGNAFTQAHPEKLLSLMEEYPHTPLTTFGLSVGLPEGQMGNSEVGHLNIGAGRVVEQYLGLIEKELTKALQEKAIPAPLAKLLENSRSHRIHLIGLLSEGGVHSSFDQLKQILSLLSLRPVEIALHLISDGRDVPPQQFLEDSHKLLAFLTLHPTVKCEIVTLSGRFYTMDRDTRWERIEKAYRAIAQGQGKRESSLEEAVTSSYQEGVSDEFIVPCVFDNYAGINADDGVLFWNFRSDRMREIVRALTSEDFSFFPRSSLPVARERCLCLTEYDASLKLPLWFEQLSLRPTLGEVIANEGLTQLRAAETEKYPHVTYFLNGGFETPYAGELRLLVPSPREVKTYDEKPEMSAFELTNSLIEMIKRETPHLIVVNYANCDMVGHTGSLEAATMAVKAVDSCLSTLEPLLSSLGYITLIIADHGNAEQMIDYVTLKPHTAHTTFPVPCILVNAPKDLNLRSGGALCDIAPTILELMGVSQPKEMTGQSLLQKSKPL